MIVILPIFYGFLALAFLPVLVIFIDVVFVIRLIKKKKLDKQVKEANENEIKAK